MANVLFNSGREGILDETIKLNSNDIRVIFVKSTYTFDATDVSITDLGAVDNGRSATLGTKTFTAGVFKAANTSVVALAAAASNAVIVYQYNASDASTRLIAYVDTVASGLPLTPAVGGTININFDTGANGIFKI